MKLTVLPSKDATNLSKHSMKFKTSINNVTPRRFQVTSHHQNSTQYSDPSAESAERVFQRP